MKPAIIHVQSDDNVNCVFNAAVEEVGLLKLGTYSVMLITAL